MTEVLKTLEDLKSEVIGCNRDCDLYVFDRKLREEAIKWIKNCDFRGFSITGCTNENRCIGCMKFIKFFNITEDELK